MDEHKVRHASFKVRTYSSKGNGHQKKKIAHFVIDNGENVCGFEYDNFYQKIQYFHNLPDFMCKKCLTHVNIVNKTMQSERIFADDPNIWHESSIGERFGTMSFYEDNFGHVCQCNQCYVLSDTNDTRPMAKKNGHCEFCTCRQCVCPLSVERKEYYRLYPDDYPDDAPSDDEERTVDAPPTICFIEAADFDNFKCMCNIFFMNSDENNL